MLVIYLLIAFKNQWNYLPQCVYVYVHKMSMFRVKYCSPRAQFYILVEKDAGAGNQQTVEKGHLTLRCVHIKGFWPGTEASLLPGMISLLLKPLKYLPAM